MPSCLEWNIVERKEMTQPNKEYWTGSEITNYERKQRLLAPRKDEILDTIADLVPFDERQEFRVVDVGE